MLPTGETCNGFGVAMGIIRCERIESIERCQEPNHAAMALVLLCYKYRFLNGLHPGVL
jgi:hypothetical protein